MENPDLQRVYDALAGGKKRDDLTLFINVLYAGDDGATPFDEWVKPLADYIAKLNNASHVLMMPYNEGLRAMAAVLDRAPVLAGRVMIRTSDAMGKELLPVLDRRARARAIPFV